MGKMKYYKYDNTEIKKIKFIISPKIKTFTIITNILESKIVKHIHNNYIQKKNERNISSYVFSYGINTKDNITSCINLNKNNSIDQDCQRVLPIQIKKNAKITEKKHKNSRNSVKLYVGNLHRNIMVENFRKILEKFGNLKYVKILIRRNGYRSNVFGFIKYNKSKHVKRIKRVLNKCY